MVAATPTTYDNVIIVGGRTKLMICASGAGQILET
jgi:hypothetical protein